MDKSFVDLTLLLDQGADAQGPRWQAQRDSYQNLQQVLAATPEPVVLLGAPGCGKSTILRHHELENARSALNALYAGGKPDTPLTFFIQLNEFKGKRDGDPPPLPMQWLCERWAQRNPELPKLPALLQSGQMTLLLDALNEIPCRNPEVITLWKDFLTEILSCNGKTRVIFSCRSLDYSATLSTADRPVHQVRIESLSNDKVRQFLLQYSPEYGETLWDNLDNTAQLDVFRSPFFLKMLIDESIAGEIPSGRAALFTAFVRRLLKREIEKGNSLFEADELLHEADIQWLIHASNSDSPPCALPQHGILIAKLEELAYRMQLQTETSESGQVKIADDQALALLGHPHGEKIIAAGIAMDILEKQPGAKYDQIFYLHQLLQEYFAARHFIEAPQYSGLQQFQHKLKNWLQNWLRGESHTPPTVQLAKQDWRTNRVSPNLAEKLEELKDSDPLPPLPTTGWEETFALASAMLQDPDPFIAKLMPLNLELAGRCAAQPDVHISNKLKNDLQWALVKRTQNPKADLRARIAAGFALGQLGDPRYQKKSSQDGAFLLPPRITIPGGVYSIGSDEGLYDDEAPAHAVSIQTLQMAQFPVTNAEWHLFMEAGGYANERWWTNGAARAWRRGENTAEGTKRQWRENRKNFQDHFADIREWQSEGRITSEQADNWEQIAQWSDETFEEWLAKQSPGGKLTEPAFWHDDAFNRSAQPVVGICWYEARAYCAWLSAQSGLSFRLPSEAEWEAAARGSAVRRYAYGNDFNANRANTFESHIRATTPIAVFPGGKTPEGLQDMTGNVWEWTSSMFQAYPYDCQDGRENSEKGEGRRVVRGGSWYNLRDFARSAFRLSNSPDVRLSDLGFRVVCSSPIS